jgi:hypothetical protein
MTSAKYLDYDPAARTYRLPDEHAYLVASDDSDHFMGGLFPIQAVSNWRRLASLIGTVGSVKDGVTALGPRRASVAYSAASGLPFMGASGDRVTEQAQNCDRVVTTWPRRWGRQ